ncbi:MAG: EscU/YscU/HrcU family type III secretion system export apparatus switch protein [Planctomycetota bacterium]
MTHESEPPDLVIGLSYSRESRGAPRVVAKGRGEVAARILAAAEEAGVPVRRDRDLAQLLAAIDLGEEIPDEAYAAVAEVIAFLWRLNAARTDPANAQ